MLIFTPDFMWSIVGVTGAGVTGALVVIMMFSKSKRYKTLGRLALIPTFFSINEPVMFGVPIVLNPRFFIPMMLAPQILCFDWLVLYQAWINESIYDGFSICTCSNRCYCRFI